METKNEIVTTPTRLAKLLKLVFTTHDYDYYRTKLYSTDFDKLAKNTLLDTWSQAFDKEEMLKLLSKQENKDSLGIDVSSRLQEFYSGLLPGAGKLGLFEVIWHLCPTFNRSMSIGQFGRAVPGLDLWLESKREDIFSSLEGTMVDDMPYPTCCIRGQSVRDAESEILCVLRDLNSLNKIFAKLGLYIASPGIHLDVVFGIYSLTEEKSVEEPFGPDFYTKNVREQEEEEEGVRPSQFPPVSPPRPIVYQNTSYSHPNPHEGLYPGQPGYYKPQTGIFGTKPDTRYRNELKPRTLDSIVERVRGNHTVMTPVLFEYNKRYSLIDIYGMFTEETLQGIMMPPGSFEVAASAKAIYIYSEGYLRCILLPPNTFRSTMEYRVFDNFTVGRPDVKDSSRFMVVWNDSSGKETFPELTPERLAMSPF